jgi:uncharacterized protein
LTTYSHTGSAAERRLQEESGTCERAADFRERQVRPGRRARFWVEVTVDEAYVHCSKCIPRLEPGPRPARTRSEDADYFHAGNTGSPPAARS